NPNAGLKPRPNPGLKPRPNPGPNPKSAGWPSVFDIHQTGHGNALSVSGYPILAKLDEMKEKLR
ncbi:hypothetical protein ABZ372_54690, partial [Streptomyces sp. NPDC005921]